MGLQPAIARKREFAKKTCVHCGKSFAPSGFAPSKSIFFKDGSLPICNNCVREYLDKNDFSWAAINKLCQYGDIPFIPAQWEKMYLLNREDTFPIYAELFAETGYEDLGWQEYFDAFKEMKETGEIENEIPGFAEKRKRELRQRWGANYDDEALGYLENLYNGLMTTQNVNGSLQVDQAIKLCKISYEIDCRIRAGQEFDKLLASYDKLVKIAEFTPKNVKNINDFDSVGELIKWMEKRGWKNKFYDDVTRDVVDETMKNYQNFVQRLYTNESGIGDEITNRIQALNSIQRVEQESYYNTNSEYDLDNFDNDGYRELFKDEDDSFDTDIVEDDIY